MIIIIIIANVTSNIEIIKKNSSIFIHLCYADGCANTKTNRNKFCLAHTDIFLYQYYLYWIGLSPTFNIKKSSIFSPLVGVCEIHFSLFTAHFQCKRSFFYGLGAIAFDRFHIFFFLFAMDIFTFFFCVLCMISLKNIPENACTEKQSSMYPSITLLYILLLSHTNAHPQFSCKNYILSFSESIKLFFI